MRQKRNKITWTATQSNCKMGFYGWTSEHCTLQYIQDTWLYNVNDNWLNNENIVHYNTYCMSRHVTVHCKWQMAEQCEHCPVQYILHVKRRDCTVYIVNDNWLKIVQYNTCDMWYICTVICDTGVTGHCTIYFRTGYCTS